MLILDNSVSSLSCLLVASKNVKKSAGQSVQQSLQDGPQAKVDNFVNQYPRPLCSQQQVMVHSNVKCIQFFLIFQNCNDFLAGDLIC